MSLQLVVGSAGSGKSSWMNRYIIEESIKNPEQKYMILVPDQFTMETQRMIVHEHPGKGTMNIDVLSFVRLAHKVFREMGCEDYVVLDDMGKCVILQKAALKYADSLKVFGRNLKKRGFIGELKSMLSELYQYGISPEQLEEAGKKLPGRSILSGKLQDMITVYRAFAGELMEGTITAEEILPSMCRMLPESEVIKDAVILLDGFTGFTPVQYQVLALLLEHASKVVVTVTTEPLETYRKEAPPYELFHLSRHTIAKLAELAKELQIPLEPDICFVRSQSEAQILEKRLEREKQKAEIIYTDGGRFRHNPQLGFLEQNVMRFGTSGVYSASSASAEGLFLSVYASPAEEVRGICDRIYELVMEQGYRYREIAVITGNPEAYFPLFQQALRQYGMPVFMDQKNSLASNPLAEYIRSLFDIVQKDFSYESIFRFLKCGLGTISLEDRDYLENYVIAQGIRGHKRWGEVWERRRRSGNYTDFARLNGIRESVYQPLSAFRERWKEKTLTVRERIEILVAFLQEQKIEAQMNELCEELTKQGAVLIAREYEQAYGLVMNLLQEIETLLGDSCMTPADFSACFDSGLEEIRVGLIPACTDRLLIGDMERTRLNGIKVLFFAGVNEGQVPKNSSGGGIFTDFDKEQLLRCEIELSPTGRMSSFMDRFYLYLALSRASDRLYISYVKNDGNGKAMRPASCIGEILHFYKGMAIRDEEYLGASEENMRSPAALWKYLVQGLYQLEAAQKNRVWLEVYSYFYRKKPDAVEKLLQACADGYEEESLTAELAKKLYGQALSASVSRLEQQAACAFSHFLKYGLELQERETFSFETSDMGNLFHTALEKYFREVREQKLDISRIQEAKRKELVHSCVAAAAKMTGSEILDDCARNQWLAGRLERITDRTVWALGEQLKEGGYETDGCEVQFQPDNTEAFVIPLTEELKMFLRGRIDRIDTRTADDCLYVRIVDYKSGSRTFDLVSVYYGLQIQLVFYMEAAQENLKKRNRNLNIRPGGVLYYNINDPIVDRMPQMDEEQIEQEILKKLQMNGMVTDISLEEEVRKELAAQKGSRISMVSEAQFQSMQKYVHESIQKLGSEIMEGDIRINPYIKGQNCACTWCSYRSICGFDQKRRGFRYRNLAAVSKDEIWERMLEAEEEEVEVEGIEQTERGIYGE